MAEQLGSPGAWTAGEVEHAAFRPELLKCVGQLSAAGKIKELVKVVRREGAVVGALLGQDPVLS